jgi:hypothetical protein
MCCGIDLLRFFFSVSLSFFVENNPRRPGGVGVCSVFSDLTWCSIPGYFLTVRRETQRTFLYRRLFVCLFVFFWGSSFASTLFVAGRFVSFFPCL